MKKILLVFCFSLFVFHFSFSQNPGEWMWIHGSDTANNAGSFGVQGIPSPTNVPPALYEPCEWTDLNGNFWLFGGLTSTLGCSNDLWRYVPSLNEWTWMSGTQTSRDTGNYGIQGVASSSNRAPSRSWGAQSWVDNAGNLWLFGGAINGNPVLNDLWKYDISTNVWTWMKGSNIPGQTGRYGVKGVADTLNNPASRGESAAAWTDNAGNLWLFGGVNGTFYQLNDLWKYDPAANAWTWMKGDTVQNGGTMGIKGVENPLNNPPSMWTFSRWKDKNGNLWIFDQYHSSLWRYNPVTNNWAWMHGDMTGTGVYGTKCAASAANQPDARNENRATWTDANGNFWMFGGFEYNDLWMFDVAFNMWKWVSGDNYTPAPGSWGTLNVSSPNNKPIGRQGSIGWRNDNCHLYLFGGSDRNYTHFYNDLWIYAMDPACSGTCSILPKINFTSSDTTLCAEGNNCVSFSDFSSGSPTSWQWHFTGGYPDTSSQKNPTHICYGAPGTYAVTLIVTNSSGHDSLTVPQMITVGGTPPPPAITTVGNMLYSSHGLTYQWYLNGNPISGATDSFYVSTQQGTYSVRITDANGCSSLSQGLILTVQEISDGGGIEIYPNPTDKQLVVRSSEFIGKNARMEIYNVLGEKVFPQNGELLTTNHELKIDVSFIFPGVYFIYVLNDHIKRVGKFVKQ